ncbi:M16 family metallopeptidase [Trichothermofontia sp.]
MQLLKNRSRSLSAGESPLWGLLSCLLGLSIFLGNVPASLALTPRHYTDLAFAPLPTIQLPDATHFTLGNGISVYLIESRDLPLVSGLALFRTGERQEPVDRAGVANLTGTVLRTGGTRHHSGDVINALLEQRAATIETDINTVLGSASFSALSEDLPWVLSLLAEILQEPVFAQDKIDLAKAQLRGAIARRNDAPREISQREFSKLLYGADSPYVRTLEYTDLDKLQREDLITFYRQSFRPERMILGLVGDFDVAQVRSLLQQHFGTWQGDPNVPPLPDPPPVQPAHQGGVFTVEQPQLTQSFVQMGHLGGRFDSPDYPALDVLNGVLNGFGGRLGNEVRSRQGLAYSVYAFWSPAYDYPGIFVAGGQTRSETTVPFIEAIRAQLVQLQTKPITAAELAYAKDSVLNAFVFNFASPSQTLSRLLRYDYFGYPPDTLFRYQQGVESTTITDIQRVARTYLNLDNLVTLVVGNPPAMQPPLESLSFAKSVTAIDITIPPPAAS